MQYPQIAPPKTVNYLTIAMPDRVPDDVDKAGLLRRSWLSGLSEDIVQDALACASLRAAEDGTLVHARGAEADGLYTIARGAVRFTRTTASGQATTITVLESPSWFGEISLFDGMPRTHDGHACGSTILMFHAKTDFKRLLMQHPVIFERFAKMLCLRLRATFDLVEEAATAPLPQRLARRLLELAHARGSALHPDARSVSREVPLTQEELGHLLGRSRQSIAKQLRNWEDEGIVETRYGRISIRHADALAALAYPERAPLRA